MEQGVAPWRCSWNRYGFARNYATGHIYSGVNAILMNLTPHPIPYFMTFNRRKQKAVRSAKEQKRKWFISSNHFSR
jgi:antirestriction protein ArdC